MADTVKNAEQARAQAQQAQGSPAKDADAARKAAGVATTAENAKLEHSDVARRGTGGGEGKGAPATTRDDLHDVGVPMLQGSPAEPQGPEDAFGAGPKRGDYTSRQDGSAHLEFVARQDGGEPILGSDGTVVDYTPGTVGQVQNPRVEDIGDAPGLKGGVDTHPASPVEA